jgi:hypothetical protein
MAPLAFMKSAVANDICIFQLGRPGYYYQNDLTSTILQSQIPNLLQPGIV